jgi:5-methylcytosine-specific restriction endonuclease McrA
MNDKILNAEYAVKKALEKMTSLQIQLDLAKNTYQKMLLDLEKEQLQFKLEEEQKLRKKEELNNIEYLKEEEQITNNNDVLTSDEECDEEYDEECDEECDEEYMKVENNYFPEMKEEISVDPLVLNIELILKRNNSKLSENTIKTYTSCIHSLEKDLKKRFTSIEMIVDNVDEIILILKEQKVNTRNTRLSALMNLLSITNMSQKHSNALEKIRVYASSLQSVKKKKKKKPKKRVKKKEAIPQALRLKVWRTQFGDNFIGNCYVCKRTLYLDSFEAGHIVSESNGGKLNINNLLPICKPCNGSCGTRNLFDFINILRLKKSS